MSVGQAFGEVEIAISAVTLAELVHGVARAKQRRPHGAYCTIATAFEKRPVFKPVASYWRLVPPVNATRLATIAV